MSYKEPRIRTLKFFGTIDLEDNIQHFSNDHHTFALTNLCSNDKRTYKSLSDLEDYAKNGRIILALYGANRIQNTNQSRDTYLLSLEYIPQKSITLEFMDNSKKTHHSAFPLSYRFKTFKEWTKIILPKSLKIHPNLDFIYAKKSLYQGYLCKEHYIGSTVPKYMTKRHNTLPYYISIGSSEGQKEDFDQIEILPHEKNTFYVTVFIINTKNIIEDDITIQFHKNEDRMKKDYHIHITQKNHLSEHEKLHHIKFFNTRILPSLLTDGQKYCTDIHHESKKFNTPYTPIDILIKNIETYRQKKNIIL